MTRELYQVFMIVYYIITNCTLNRIFKTFYGSLYTVLIYPKIEWIPLFNSFYSSSIASEKIVIYFWLQCAIVSI